MNKVKAYFISLYDYLFAVLIILLPYSKALPNIIFGILAIIFIIRSKKADYTNYLKSPFVILTVLIIYLWAQAIINGSFISDISYYKKHLCLAVIPLLFTKVKNFKLLKLTALIIINTTIIVSLYRILDFRMSFGYFPFNEGWATNYVLLLERPYAGLLSVISIIISFDMMKKDQRFKYLYLLSGILSVIFISFIAIRVSVITIFILFIFYISFYLKISAGKKLLAFASIVAIFAVILISNQNIVKRFFIQQTFEKTIESAKSHEPRFVIFGCAREITEEPDFSMLFGTDSYSNIVTQLVSCYEKSITEYSRKNFFSQAQFNCHSQILDLYLIGGIIAIVCFLLFYIAVFVRNKNNFSAVAILISFGLVMIIENIFHRQFGCYIFIIFTALYANEKRITSNG